MTDSKDIRENEFNPSESALDQTKGIADEQPVQEQSVSGALDKILSQANIELPREEEEEVEKIVDEELILGKEEPSMFLMDFQNNEILKNIPKEVDDRIPFVFKEKMKPFQAICDEKAIVTVKLSKLADEFKWFFNNKEVTSDNQSFTTKETRDGVYSLNFIQCTMQDDKKPVKYIAKYRGKNDLIDTIRMKVKPAKPELFKNSKIKDFYEVGEDITLDIRVKGRKNHMMLAGLRISEKLLK